MRLKRIGLFCIQGKIGICCRLRERMNEKRRGVGWRGREASVDRRRGYESNSSEVAAVERSAEQLIQS